MNPTRSLAALLVVLIVTAAAGPAFAQSGQTVRIATFNVEHFNKMFDQLRLPSRSQNRTERFRDEEDLYEVATTIRLETFDADVIALQECCDQEMLEMFAERWLGGDYTFVKVFAGHTPGQWTGMLAKKGIEVLEVREMLNYPDPVDDPEIRRKKEGYGGAKKVFARGPGFVKFKTEAGYVFWVGTSHIKSKGGDSPAMAKWRARQVAALRTIAHELASSSNDTDDVFVCGDFNDTFGQDRNEKAAKVDAIGAMLEGGDKEPMVCLTKPILDANPLAATYHCEIKPPTYRGFIDHIFATPTAAKMVVRTWIVEDPIAKAASDHLPVVTEVKVD